MKLQYISSVLLLAIGAVEAMPVVNPYPGNPYPVNPYPVNPYPGGFTHSAPRKHPKPYQPGDYRGQRWRHSGNHPTYGVQKPGDKWSKPSYPGRQPPYGGQNRPGDRGGKGNGKPHGNDDGEDDDPRGKPTRPGDSGEKSNGNHPGHADSGKNTKPTTSYPENAQGQPYDEEGKPVYDHLNQQHQPCDDKGKVIPHKKNGKGEILDSHGTPMKKAAPATSRKNGKNMYDSKTFGSPPPADKVCLKWVTVKKHDSCDSIVKRIAGSSDSCTKGDLIRWNYNLGNNCSGIKKVKRVCIKVPTWYPKPE